MKSMEIDLTRTLSIIAIIISIIAIIISKRNLKKQLRLSKLEEILEDLQFIQGYYTPLFWLFHDTTEVIDGKSKSNDLHSEIVEKRRIAFAKIVDRETVITKIARLKILANSYLNNGKDLKSKILIMSDIYYSMYVFINTKGEKPQREKITIIPKPAEMERFINQIDHDVILEMNLGYKGLDKKTYDIYLKNQFKKDLNKK